MAVSHNVASNTILVGGTTVSVTPTVLTGSNHAALIGISWDDPSATGLAVQSVTFAGVTATFLQLVQTIAGNAEQYYAVGFADGPRTATVAWTGVVNASLGVEVMDNVDQTTPLGGTKTGTASSAAPSVVVPGTLADGLVVDTIFVSVDVPAALSVGAGQTSRWNNVVAAAPDRMDGAGSTEPSAAGTVTMSWTLAASRLWALCAAEFRPVTDTGKPVNCYTSYQYTADPTPIESFKDPAVQQRIWVNDRRHMQGDL